jgi:protein O-GlcNAc transferase
MCKARNILFDFKNLNSKNSNNRYRENIIQPGDVGGHCKLNIIDFNKQGGHRSPLQSWFAELGNFQEFDYRPIKDDKCDVIIEGPTFLIKLDAGNKKKINFFIFFF